MDSHPLCAQLLVLGMGLLWVTSLLFRLGLAAVSEGWQLVVVLESPRGAKERGHAQTSGRHSPITNALWSEALSPLMLPVL